MESLAGLVGPAIGGLLFRCGAEVPLYSVVGIYAAIFVAVFFFYRDCFSPAGILSAKAHARKAEKME